MSLVPHAPWVPRAPESADPVTWMLDCHARIRRTTGGVRALAGAAVDDPRAATTATDCERYLRIGLPLHAADEEHSLRPLLLRPPGGGALGRALDRMSSEHGRIEEGLPQACALLLAASRGEGDRVALAELASWLEGLLLPHIEHEEERILPAAATLSPQDQAALAAMLRARRAPPARAEEAG